LALACTPSDGTKSARQGAVPPPTDSIVLERSTCFGTCPAYRLRLSDSGEVRFESRNPGDEGRRVTDTIAASTFPALISTARSIGFFDLPSKILGDSVLCRIARSDAPTVVITIFTKAQTKQVQDYLGCSETRAHETFQPLVRLRAFEVEIDSAVGSSRWVRPASRR
jgi:Domain of unknown function (DUF6438)